MARVAQTQILSQGAEGVQSSFYPRTALFYVEQTWGDPGYRKRREPTAALKLVQLCWDEADVPSWSSCDQLGSPSSWENSCQLRRFKTRNLG